MLGTFLYQLQCRGSLFFSFIFGQCGNSLFLTLAVHIDPSTGGDGFPNVLVLSAFFNCFLYTSLCFFFFGKQKIFGFVFCSFWLFPAQLPLFFASLFGRSNLASLFLFCFLCFAFFPSLFLLIRILAATTDLTYQWLASFPTDQTAPINCLLFFYVFSFLFLFFFVFCPWLCLSDQATNTLQRFDFFSFFPFDTKPLSFLVYLRAIPGEWIH